LLNLIDTPVSDTNVNSIRAMLILLTKLVEVSGLVKEQYWL